MKVTSSRPAAVRKASSDVVTLSGAALKRAMSILKAKIPDHLKADGVASLKGKPTFHAIGIRGSYEVTGKVDVNALWGGDETRNFKAKIALAQGTLTGFKSW